MGMRIVTTFTDDITGAEISEQDVRTVQFSLEGAGYAIDLGPDSAAELREELAPFVAAARRQPAKGKKRAASSAPAGEQSAARAWLIEQGIDVPARGRVSAELLERYRSR